LLPSQLAILEPLGPDEPGVTVSGEGDPDEVVREALRLLDLDPDSGPVPTMEE
jgi:gluconokinase